MVLKDCDMQKNSNFNNYLHMQMVKEGLIRGFYKKKQNDNLLYNVLLDIHNNPAHMIALMFKEPWLDLYIETSNKYLSVYRALYMTNENMINTSILDSIVKWMLYNISKSEKFYLNSTEYDKILLDNGLYKPSIIWIGKNHYKILKNVNNTKAKKMLEQARYEYNIYEKTKNYVLPSNIIDVYIKAESTILRQHLMDRLFSFYLDDNNKINFNQVLYSKNIILKLLELALIKKDNGTIQDILNLIIGVFIYCKRNETYDLRESVLNIYNGLSESAIPNNRSEKILANKG